MTQKLAFGERVNKWLDEPEGSIFKNGKWRFWFPMLLGFSVLNVVLTAMIFGSNGGLQTYIGGIMLAVGVLIAWSCIGTLHYSDSRDAKLSKGVSILDSITLCFVIAHFCFLLWAQGHLMTLKDQETKYQVSATAYNEKIEKLSSDNVKIAEASAQTAKETTNAERLRNDTAYQLRRAAETGNVARARIASNLKDHQSSSLSLASIELEKPQKPDQSSAAFLMKWDSFIRILNFGELILAAITFIFIRNRSAKFNAQRLTSRQTDLNDFPSELDLEESSRLRNGKPSLVSLHGDTGKDKVSTQATRVETQTSQLRTLRAYLKEISFYHPGYSFKADARSDFIWLRMMKSENGREDTIASTKAAIAILDDVMRMKPDAFKSRLVTFLQKRDFPIEVV